MRDPDRFYIQDDLDEAAFKLYAASGFNPPIRPVEWVDAYEASSWEKWRQRAKEASVV